MRRRLRRQLTAAVLLTAALLVAGASWFGRAALLAEDGPVADLAGTARTLTYLEPGADAWLEFPLQPGRSLVRIVSTANLVPEAIPGLGDLARFDYALEYQLLAASGEPGPIRRYHETALLDPASRGRAFYLDDRMVPTSSQSMRLDLTGNPMRTIRVRIAERDPGIRDVGLRAYLREPVSERERGFRWQRLTREQQARLYAGSVYPPEFARAQERELLSETRWVPLGPAGVSGVDYRTRPLYLRDDDEFGSLRTPATPDGVPAGPESRAVVPIPEGTTAVRLEFEPPRIGDRRDRMAALTWYPEGLASPRRWRVDLSGGRGSTRIEAGPGSVVVAASAAVQVRAFADDGEVPMDLTPTPTITAVWRVTRDAPLEWTLTPSSAGPLPVRVDLRPLRSTASPARPAEVTLEILSEDGVVLRREVLRAEHRHAAYERTLPGPDPIAGAPVRTYLHLPRDAARLRVSGREAAAVSVFVRPPELPYALTVPADYADYVESPPRPALWYALVPDAEERLLRSGRRLLLAIAPEPSPPDPEVLAGRYRFERLVPSGDVLERDLMLPRAGLGPVRASGLGAWYRPLAAGEEASLEFRSDPLAPRAAPRLLWRHASGTTGTLRLTLDGRGLPPEAIAGRQGALTLPLAGTGTHRLRVDAPAGVELWVNRAGRTPDGVNRLLRTAQRLPGDGRLRFEVRKDARPSRLTFALHRPLGADEPADVQVRVLDAPRPDRSDDFTVPSRRFRVAAADEPGAWVLGAAGELDAGEPFFVELGEDLPAGRYVVDLRVRAPAGAHLTAWRIDPGTTRRERFELDRQAPEDDEQEDVDG